MAHTRGRNLIRRRRRTDDEEEEEDVALDDGSGSEGSLLSDAEGGLDMDDESEVARNRDINGVQEDHDIGASQHAAPYDGDDAQRAAQPRFAETADVAAMRNGVVPAEGETGDSALQFDDAIDGAGPESGLTPETEPPAALEQSGGQGHHAHRMSRSHVKHDNAPTIPSRGGFFMHDHRVGRGSAANGFGSSMRGRGRGKNNFLSPSYYGYVQFMNA